MSLRNFAEIPHSETIRAIVQRLRAKGDRCCLSAFLDGDNDNDTADAAMTLAETRRTARRKVGTCHEQRGCLLLAQILRALTRAQRRQLRGLLGT